MSSLFKYCLFVVVAKIDVQNCTTSKETQLLIHQNIEDRRNRNKPWPHSTEQLISQLNDECIEILNSQQDRQTVIVWIWCRSQTALEYIQSLYDRNRIKEVLYGVANIQTLTLEIGQSNVISIEDNQFKKAVGKFFRLNLA